MEKSRLTKSTITAIVSGVFLEYYDYMLYMHFLVVLTPFFFPNNDPNISVLIGFATFALANFVQPLGAIVFGHVGDKFGRKTAMTLAIALTTLSTFSIGLLPTYAQAGLIGSILLIACRFLQSFSVGGEVPGASCFLIENSTKDNRCLRSSYIVTACTVPGIVAAFLGYIFTSTSMPQWGWRVPFLVTLLFGTLGFYIRYKLPESFEFQKVIEKKEILKFPLLEVIKKDRRAMLCTLGICAGVEAPFSILYVYLPHMIKDTLKIPIDQIFALNAFMMTFTAFCLPIMGAIADKIGARKMMAGGSLVFITVIYPLFLLIKTAQGIWPIFISQLIISFIWSATIAPLNAITNLMYPTQRRFSGNAFSWGIGCIVFVGLSPIISKSLVMLTGEETSVALFLIVCGIACIFAVIKAPDISGEQDDPLKWFRKNSK